MHGLLYGNATVSEVLTNTENTWNAVLARTAGTVGAMYCSCILNDVQTRSCAAAAAFYLSETNLTPCTCLFIAVCLSSYFRATAKCSSLFCCPVTIAYSVFGISSTLRVGEWNDDNDDDADDKTSTYVRTDKQIALTATHKTNYLLLIVYYEKNLVDLRLTESGSSTFHVSLF